MAQSHPVNILYDQELIDENSNIARELTVPIGVARTRDQNDRFHAESVFVQLRDGLALGDGWQVRKPVAQSDPRFKRLAKYDPGNPKPTSIGVHITGVLRLSRGVNMAGSAQTVQGINAQSPQVVHREAGLIPRDPQMPISTTQIIVASGKDLGQQSKGPLRRLVGLNGKR